MTFVFWIVGSVIVGSTLTIVAAAVGFRTLLGKWESQL